MQMFVSVLGRFRFSPAPPDKVARTYERFKKEQCLFLAIPHTLIAVLQTLSYKYSETSLFDEVFLEDR